MSRSVRKHNLVRFWCPGCDDLHQVDAHLWVVTGENESLTISPSILVYGHQKLINDDLEWEELLAPDNITTTPRCHSFVTDGKIRFLDDCTHASKNETLSLPEMPDWCLGEGTL
jgi:hypothetical protein